jgi:hypothetical protein
VVALDLLWSLNVALALAAGTVWSLPLAMIKSAARSSFLMLILLAAFGLKFARAAWKRTRPGPGTA